MPRPPMLAAIAALVVAIALALLLAPRWLPGLRLASPAARPVPSLAGVQTWVQSPALSDDSLRGRPLVLLAWCDTDPRALEALPVLEAWRHAYAPLGVRVVGVHAPDFAFAADSAVPARIARSLAPSLPVALDPSLSVISRLGGPTEGPHVLVASERGDVRVDTVGLAGLSAAELSLREIVRAFRPGATLPPPVAHLADRDVRTVYLGTSRSPAGPLAGLPAGRAQTFTTEFRYQQEGARWIAAPVGTWRPAADGLESRRGGAADFVAIRYSAARVGVVASAPAGQRGRFWVLKDEQWPGPDAGGVDLASDAGGAWVEVAEPRLYWIDRGTGEHVLKLSPDRSGLTIHAFVFDGVPPGAARE